MHLPKYLVARCWEGLTAPRLPAFLAGACQCRTTHQHARHAPAKVLAAQSHSPDSVLTRHDDPIEGAQRRPPTSYIRADPVPKTPEPLATPLTPRNSRLTRACAVPFLRSALSHSDGAPLRRCRHALRFPEILVAARLCTAVSRGTPRCARTVLCHFRHTVASPDAA